MTAACPHCQSHHIRNVKVKNFAYCSVCNHKWVIDENLPSYPNSTVCMTCWGTGYKLLNKLRSQCESCDGGGWL